MREGTKVGSGRWPYHGSHPGCWKRPIPGTVLAMNDVRAWQDSLLAGDKVVTQTMADEFAAYVGDDHSLVPVMWHGDEGDFFYWEEAHRLVPYHRDLERWMQVRSERLAQAHSKAA